MLRFISFGSGSSGNCYYLLSEEGGLLIDAGIGVRTIKKAFRDYGLDLNSIRAILVTHDHFDHVSSVGSLSYQLSLPVYATKLVHEGIKRNYHVGRKIEEINKHFIEKGQQIDLAGFTITPFDVPHDSKDNVGFCIERRSATFCVITDIGHITDCIKSYISKATHMVIEANHDEEMLRMGPYPTILKDRISGGRGHLSNKLCGLAIAENMGEGLRNIWLCHLSEENNHPQLALKTVETILEENGKRVGERLSIEVLRRRTPTGIFDLEST